jgi:hypothetical protein
MLDMKRSLLFLFKICTFAIVLGACSSHDTVPGIPEQAAPLIWDATQEFYLPPDGYWFRVILDETLIIKAKGNPVTSDTLDKSVNSDFAISISDSKGQTLNEFVMQTAFNGVGRETSYSLKPGQYNFKILSKTKDEYKPYVGNYQIEFTKKESPDKNVEPNDSPEQATLINITSDTPIYNLPLNDIDWFKLVLVEDTVFNLSLPSDIPLDVKVHNGDLQPIAEVNTDKFPGLKVGTYYFRISKKDSDSPFAGEYYFGLGQGYAARDKAIEPNDSPERATPVVNGSSIVHDVLIGDEDWFTFTLEQQSYFRLCPPLIPAWCDSNRCPNPEAFYPVEFFDGSLKLTDMKADGFVRVLSPGKYYFRPSRSTNESVSSSNPFNTDIVPLSNKKYEPNNTREQAYPITSGFSDDLDFIPGDEDWFKFTVSRPSLVVVTIEETGFISAELWNDTGTLQFFETLTPGTYYIRFTVPVNLSQFPTQAGKNPVSVVLVDAPALTE